MSAPPADWRVIDRMAYAQLKGIALLAHGATPEEIEAALGVTPRAVVIGLCAFASRNGVRGVARLGYLYAEWERRQTKGSEP